MYISLALADGDGIQVQAHLFSRSVAASKHGDARRLASGEVGGQGEGVIRLVGDAVGQDADDFHVLGLDLLEGCRRVSESRTAGFARL